MLSSRRWVRSSNSWLVGSGMALSRTQPASEGVSLYSPVTEPISECTPRRGGIPRRNGGVTAAPPALSVDSSNSVRKIQLGRTTVGILEREERNERRGCVFPARWPGRPRDGRGTGARGGHLHPPGRGG